MTTSSFAIGANDFLLNGQPYRILSGALHYFRVHPDQWADRIHKARLMGLNTIETYVAWNFHAPTVGEWDATGPRDLGRFLQLVADEGMTAIVRPGPYICAEWDNGGFPAWLFAEPGVGVRRLEPGYMRHVTEYLERVLDIVEPLQISRGGPVILVQIENEYGAYGSDAEYLRELVRITRDAGIDVPLTSVDQPTDAMLANGSIPGLHKTASFGSRSTERLATLRRHQPEGPLMCAEFWDGWFDSWGEHHNVTSAEQAANDLDLLLAAGASVNFYMFHGGTNFGLTNGANDKGLYRPIVTSYDYDAPLDELGNPTDKFWAFREVIARYEMVPEEVPAQAADLREDSIALAAGVDLFELLESAPREFSRTPTADELGGVQGFTLYEATRPVAGELLEVGEVRDRAQVFADGRPIGVLARDHHDRRLQLSLTEPARLRILVEDQGRVNYGSRIGEPKGLIGPVTIDGVELGDWAVSPLDIDALAARAHTVASPLDPTVSHSGPAFFTGSFAAVAGEDRLLDTAQWGKGVVWVNGFCLGRYWSRGPQATLFVPGPIVREQNAIVVLELHALQPVARFASRLDLGPIDS